MATREFPLESEPTTPVDTPHRRVRTPIPVPESLPLLKQLRQMEPRSMGGQPPIIWHHGRGANIFDPYGNMFLDFSAGVLVTASGHGHPRIAAAIADMAGQGLYHAYCFPTQVRLALVTRLTAMLPPPLARVFLLTTGSEAVECCLKLARTHGLAVGGPGKRTIVSFDNGFHGRTMGSQAAGGSPGGKAWLGGDLADRFVQVPFPDGFRQKDLSFASFEEGLRRRQVRPEDVCGVIAETYQGCNATLMPAPYAQALRLWCDRHQAVMILDEIQAGFGRTGRRFGFEHLGGAPNRDESRLGTPVVPDLVACGKGLGGGMPISAVLGRDDLMNYYGPGEMTSTHSANPVCCAASLANLDVIEQERLIENAAALAPVLAEGARRIQAAAGGAIAHTASAGLVAALQFCKPGTTEPDPEPAWRLTWECVKRGIMLFAPVGVGGSAIKINPPLVIRRDALEEGLAVMVEACRELH